MSGCSVRAVFLYSVLVVLLLCGRASAEQTAPLSSWRGLFCRQDHCLSLLGPFAAKAEETVSFLVALEEKDKVVLQDEDAPVLQTAILSAGQARLFEPEAGLSFTVVGQPGDEEKTKLILQGSGMWSGWSGEYQRDESSMRPSYAVPEALRAQAKKVMSEWLPYELNGSESLAEWRTKLEDALREMESIAGAAESIMTTYMAARGCPESVAKRYTVLRDNLEQTEEVVQELLMRRGRGGMDYAGIYALHHKSLRAEAALVLFSSLEDFFPADRDAAKEEPVEEED